jgi:hypothetical protein
VFPRLGHLAVLFIEEYRYSEKTFHRNVKFCPRTGYISCRFLWPGPPHQLLPVQEPAKEKVDTVSADFPYGDKILRRGEKYSRRNGTSQ